MFDMFERMYTAQVISKRCCMHVPWIKSVLEGNTGQVDILSLQRVLNLSYMTPRLLTIPINTYQYIHRLIRDSAKIMSNST